MRYPDLLFIPCFGMLVQNRDLTYNVLTFNISTTINMNDNNLTIAFQFLQVKNEKAYKHENVMELLLSDYYLVSKDVSDL